MILQLDLSSTIPFYVQIRNQIVLWISSGELPAGEGLPTVRQLAEDLGVNTMTVSKAYTLLKTEGFLEGDRRQGVRVKQLGLTPEFCRKLEDELSLLIAESKVRGMSKETFVSRCGQLFDAPSFSAMQKSIG